MGATTLERKKNRKTEIIDSNKTVTRICYAVKTIVVDEDASGRTGLNTVTVRITKKNTVIRSLERAPQRKKHNPLPHHVSRTYPKARQFWHWQLRWRQTNIFKLCIITVPWTRDTVFCYSENVWIWIIQ